MASDFGDDTFPLRLGDRIIFRHLKGSNQLNGKKGVVEGFDKDSDRYIVKVIETEKRVKVRGKNANYLRMFYPPAEKDGEWDHYWNTLCDSVYRVLMKQMNGTPILDQLEEAFLSISTFLLTNDEEGSLMVLWAIALFNESDDVLIRRKVFLRLEKQLKKPKIGGKTKVDLSIELAKVVPSCGGTDFREDLGDMRQYNKDLLIPLLDRHFGRLPEIASIIVDETNKEMLHQRLLPILKSGNHQLWQFQEEAHYFWRIIDNSTSFHTSKNMSLAKSAMKHLDIMNPDECSGLGNVEIVKMCKLKGRAALLFVEKHYSEALDIWKEVLNNVISRFGDCGNCRYDTSTLWLNICDCAIQLGDKELAKKALKKAKQLHVCSPQDLTIRQAAITMMKTRKISKNTSFPDLIQVQACSYPECRNTGAGFKQCGKCRSVCYCSRSCQEKHWKNGHKATCKVFSKKFWKAHRPHHSFI